MSWTDIDDPEDTWSNVPQPSRRHTYEKEYGETTRIVFGDNVEIDGGE